MDMQVARTRVRGVVEARYLGDYRIWARFDNGHEGLIDLEDDLWGEDQHVALRNMDLFSELYVDKGRATIVWDNGSDFNPEYLYARLTRLH
jgi:hypothetical protein